MPIPDLSGVPPWAEYEDLKNKINDIVAKYNNLLVNLDSLNVVSLTADHIDAGTIDANLVTIRSDLTAGAYIQIDGNGMKINNGTYDTFTANINGYVTMTGALIQSKNGYPMLVMDPDNNLFGAYSNETNYIQMVPVAVDTGSPQLRMVSPVGSLSLYQQANVSLIYGFNSEIRLESQRDIVLTPGLPANYIRMPFEQVLDTNKGTSLYAQLLSKASAGVSTGLSGSHNHGIPDGTSLRTADGGTVTFFAAGQHSHAQV